MEARIINNAIELLEGAQSSMVAADLAKRALNVLKDNGSVRVEVLNADGEGEYVMNNNYELLAVTKNELREKIANLLHDASEFVNKATDLLAANAE